MASDGLDADRIDGGASEDIAIVAKGSIAAPVGTDIGPVASPSHFDYDQGNATILSWAHGIAPSEDCLSFSSSQTGSDFDIRACLKSLETPVGDAVAGLMFRQTNAPNSPMFCALSRPNIGTDSAKSGLAVFLRRAAGQPLEKLFENNKAVYPNTWLRIRRQSGTSFSAYSSTDGLNWESLCTAEKVNLPSQGLLGLAVASGTPSASVTAAFKNVGLLRHQTWYFPSTTDCLSCHSQNAGYILGITARQLNLDMTDPNSGHAVNQLQSWVRMGLFGSSITEEQAVAARRLVPLSESTASISDRARSYLDANCAYCHQPGGAGGFFDARYSTSPEDQNLLTNQLRNALGVNEAQVVAPGDLARSILWRRVHTVYAPEKMPPIGRNTIDEKGTDLLHDWILSLKPPNK